MSRESWDEYFSNLAYFVANRATCPRRQVGVVLVGADKRIVSTGYNGASPGSAHCTDVGCDIVNGTCRRTIHAEDNALLYAPVLKIRGSTLYTTDFPCQGCTWLIMGYPVREVVYTRPYHTGMENSTVLLESSGTTVRQYIPNILLKEG